ncbi:hypothetical protein DFH09DRAFT_1372197 [Mycena vulgaris]|nr:hypothetical protein DFH09DRAFT_1372197 [Mycena vulgaris]
MSRHLVTGIHSQPEEILAEIFREVIELTGTDIMRTSEGPWLLSHVCSSWRETTLTHPQLWSIIRLEGPDRTAIMMVNLWEEESGVGDTGGRTPKAFFLLDLALQRSQQYPLEVTLDFGMPPDRWSGTGAATQKLYENLIRTVVAHSNRWKTANLQITNELIPSFAPILNHLSQLTDFTIFNTSEGSLSPFPYAKNAPGLTDVRLISYPHQLVALPWNSIRRFSEAYHTFPGELTQHGLSTQKYLKLLRDNPRLECLDVEYPSDSEPSPSTSTLTHRSLRRLVTGEESLIRSLTLPHLEELTTHLSDDTLPAIRDLIARSKCSLRSLWLINFTLDDDLLAIFSRSPSLQTLTIRFTDWDTEDDTSMQLFVKKLAEPSFLPCLEFLDICVFESQESQDYGHYDPDNSEAPKHLDLPVCKIGFINDAFVSMLAARWERRGAAGSRPDFKKVCVIVEPPSTVGLSRTRGVDRLRKLCDEGLDVVIRARDPRALDRTLRIEDIKVISYVYDL